MSKTSKKLLACAVMSVGMFASFNGVVEFDHAKSGIALFRGFFWMLMGIICARVGWEDYNNV